MRKSLLLLYLRFICRLNTCARIIHFACRRYNERNFLIDPETNTTLTYNAFSVRVAKKVFDLKHQGLHPGEVYVYSAPNSLEFFETRAACHKMGVVFFGIPAHLSLDVKEYFIDQVRGRKFPGVSTLNLSSGTTGKVPKVVIVSDENWVSSLYGYIRNATIPLGPKETFLCTVSFLAAGSATFLPAFASGMAYVVVKEDISYERIVAHIKTYHVTRLYLTPSRLIEFMEWCKKHKEKPAGLRNIITGTERLPTRVLREAIQYFGPIITVGYGMVEALPPLAMLSSKDLDRVTSAGLICKGVRIKITPEGGIAIKGKTVSYGYLNNPEETKKRFFEDWFYSNDYGWIDRDRYLYVLGRKEDIILDKPQRVFAGEIEEELVNAFDFIKHSAVLRTEAGIVVCVSLRGNATKPEADMKIRDFLSRTSLKVSIIPDKVMIMDELPINALGKLDRQKLSSS